MQEALLVATRIAMLDEAFGRGINLHDADLHNLSFPSAILYRAILSGADLRESDLNNADLSGLIAKGSNFMKANLQFAHCYEADFDGANLMGANFGGARLGGASFARANLDFARFDRADSAHLKWNARTEARLPPPVGPHGEYLVPTVYFRGARISGTDFRGFDVDRGDFGGVFWHPDHPPQWPDGFVAPDNAYVNSAHPEPDSKAPRRPARGRKPSAADASQKVSSKQVPDSKSAAVGRTIPRRASRRLKSSEDEGSSTSLPGLPSS
jgi:hypothetical protein